MNRPTISLSGRSIGIQFVAILRLSFGSLKSVFVSKSCSAIATKSSKSALSVFAAIVLIVSTVAAAEFEDMMAAAENGYAEAQLSIGLSYFFGSFVDGTPVPRNNDKAVYWLTKSADGGNTYAQLHLGRMLIAGVGVSKNESAAMTYFLAAAKSGSADARLRLAQCYLQGIGTERNVIEAYAWATLAAFQGNGAAESLVRSILPRLDNRTAAAALAEKYFSAFGISDPYPDE